MSSRLGARAWARGIGYLEGVDATLFTKSLFVAALLVVLARARDVSAAYSAPLTRVRIDSDATHYTPSVAYVMDDAGGPLDTQVRGLGAQYVQQWEWANGWGFQIGAMGGGARLTLTLPEAWTVDDHTVELRGYIASGQARFYKEVWTSHTYAPATGAERPHALTVFATVRTVHTRATVEARDYVRRGGELSWSTFATGLGVGLMAEVALGEALSFCPYAWFSPALARKQTLQVPGREDAVTRGGFSVGQPLRVGADVWFYPHGTGDESHWALSTIASFIDTEDEGRRELSVVLSYTF